MHLDAPPQVRVRAKVDVGLDDRHEPRLLAHGREAREALGLRGERGGGGERVRVAEDRGAPFGEARAGGARGEEAREEVVVALGHGLGGESGCGCESVSARTPGMMPRCCRRGASWKSRSVSE